MYDLEERTFEFAANVRKFLKTIPQKMQNNSYERQGLSEQIIWKPMEHSANAIFSCEFGLQERKLKNHDTSLDSLIQGVVQRPNWSVND